MPATSNHRKSTAEIKRERIELRVGPSAKKLIQRAMAVTGLTAGDLAYEGARRVLDEHERLILAGADREAFLEALMNPPEPSEKLIAALRRPSPPSRSDGLTIGRHSGAARQAARSVEILLRASRA
jgi:uncharacterized protein (DUF1778 family)